MLDSESLTPILEELITRSTLPLRALETQFAVDSIGFGTHFLCCHCNAKYGHDEYSRDYLRLHAIIGTKTNVAAAAQVSDRDTHESPILASARADRRAALQRGIDQRTKSLPPAQEGLVGGDSCWNRESPIPNRESPEGFGTKDQG